jgi:hypothetical protein
MFLEQVIKRLVGQFLNGHHPIAGQHIERQRHLVVELAALPVHCMSPSGSSFAGRFTQHLEGPPATNVAAGDMFLRDRSSVPLTLARANVRLS